MNRMQHKVRFIAGFEKFASEVFLLLDQLPHQG